MRARKGSHSKLNTWRDGVRILGTIVKLYRSERPLGFFSGIGISLAIMSVGFAIPIVVTYLREGIVPRLPTAVLSTGLMIIAALAITCGLVLDTVTRGRREMKLLAYLAQRAPGEGVATPERLADAAACDSRADARSRARSSRASEGDIRCGRSSGPMTRCSCPRSRPCSTVPASATWCSTRT